MKTQINIRLSERLLKEIDKYCDGVYFDNRTDFIKYSIVEAIERRRLFYDIHKNS